MAQEGLMVEVVKYRSPLGNLSKTAGDAQVVQALLKQYGQFDDIHLLTGEVTQAAKECSATSLLQ